MLQRKCFKSQRYQAVCKAVIKKKKKIFNNFEDARSTIKELKAIAKIRGIKDYKSMSKDKLLGILDKSEQAKKQN